MFSFLDRTKSTIPHRLASRLFRFGTIFLFTTIIVFSSHQSLAGDDKPSWGYGGASNPSQWSEVSPKFEACELGRDQSPINIIDPEQSEQTSTIDFYYQSTMVQVVDNGHTIEVQFEPGSSIAIDDEVYKLLQFHFHTPSEHLIDDKASAMEVHFVHQNEAGKLAVVGIMMNSGAENPVIASIWDAIPDNNKAKEASNMSLNAATLLPEDKTFLSYAGSLTTPPCSEEVSWNLLVEPIELSPEQIATFESFYPYNARPIQPLNGRSVDLN